MSDQDGAVKAAEEKAAEEKAPEAAADTSVEEKTESKEQELTTESKESDAPVTDPPKRKRRRKSGWDDPAAEAPAAVASPTNAQQLALQTAQRLMMERSMKMQQAQQQQQALMQNQRMMQMQAMMAVGGGANPQMMQMMQMMQMQQARMQAMRAMQATQQTATPIAASPGLTPAQAQAIAQAQALAQVQAVQAGGAAAQPKNTEARIYVGSLHYDLSEADIRMAFSPFGPISSVDMSFEPTTGKTKGYCFVEYTDKASAESALSVMDGFELAGRKIKVNRPNGPANGGGAAVGMGAMGMNPNFAALMAGNPALLAAQQAMMGGAMGGAAVAGAAHPALAAAAAVAAKSDPASKTKVKVENVMEAISIDQLKTVFVAFGTIKSADMAKNPLNPKEHAGWGIIEYAEEKDAQLAIGNMTGFELAGKKIKVSHARESESVNGAGAAGGGSAQPDRFELSQRLARASAAGAAAGGETTVESRCVLLENMVDEVDEELEEEVLDECSSHGKVDQIKILPGPPVKIFVLFSEIAGAASARQKLHARYFGKRQVSCTYYSADKFTAGDNTN